MTNKQRQILTDCVLEIAKKYDKCGKPDCNLTHAVVAIIANKEYFKEAVELAKKRLVDL